MRGVRRRAPPFGWDDETPPPILGWRRKKEIVGALHDEAQSSAPALQFLRRARAAEYVGPAAEPAPVEKTRQRPPSDAASGIPASVDVTAAARQRLHRERARNGRRIVSVAINSDVEDLLRASGMLQEWDADSREAVGHAVERLLELLVVADRHA
jgi:hypothetical protein